jgi:multidrug efflux pump subunit AcrB
MELPMNTESALILSLLYVALYLSPVIIAYFIKPQTRTGNFFRWFFGVGMAFALFNLLNFGWNEDGIARAIVNLGAFGFIAGIAGALLFKRRVDNP